MVNDEDNFNIKVDPNSKVDYNWLKRLGQGGGVFNRLTKQLVRLG